MAQDSVLQQLASSVDLLPDAVLVRDAGGSVLGANESFARLCGTTVKELHGQSLQTALEKTLAERFDRADRIDAPSVRFHVSLDSPDSGGRRRYLFRQSRIAGNGTLQGWTTTVREATSATVDAAQALTIARALANRNFSALRESFPDVMRQVARALGARGAIVLWKSGDWGEVVPLCRWPENVIVSEDDINPSWWSELSQFEPLRNIQLQKPATGRCDIYPIHAQWQLLGALIVVDPGPAGRSGSAGLPEFVATLFAGLIVRREIEKLLNEYSVSLEQRVKERTTDLNIAYETLQQTQAQLVQAGKMASIGQLAAGIAHEINNPLGFIKSNLGVLEKYNRRLVTIINDACTDSGELEELENEIREIIGESLEGVRRVEDIVSNLRDFARIEEGHHRLANINTLIKESLKVLQNELKYKVTIHQDLSELPEIMCRLDRLKQVFVNLLLNAVQAIEDHGEIRITTGVDEDHVMITITDTGAGIDPEIRDRVFEPFFTTKNVGSGTGLGLSIVWDIITSHGGTIIVDSTPGEGTQFTISLPTDPGNAGSRRDIDAIMRDL